MILLLLFGVALLAAALVSEIAHKSVLSTAVLFLVIGFASGASGIGSVAPEDDLGIFAKVPLFSVLFTDGMRVSFSQLRRAWRLPGRALLLVYL